MWTELASLQLYKACYDVGSDDCYKSAHSCHKVSRQAIFTLPTQRLDFSGRCHTLVKHLMLPTEVELDTIYGVYNLSELKYLTF